MPNTYLNKNNDPNLLTKSTMNNDPTGPSGKYLPKIGAGGEQPSNGYISDFYKKKNYASDGS